jgi:hypothetical protein
MDFLIVRHANHDVLRCSARVAPSFRRYEDLPRNVKHCLPIDVAVRHGSRWAAQDFEETPG